MSKSEHLLGDIILIGDVYSLRSCYDTVSGETARIAEILSFSFRVEILSGKHEGKSFFIEHDDALPLLSTNASFAPLLNKQY